MDIMWKHDYNFVIIICIHTAEIYTYDLFSILNLHIVDLIQSF